MYMNLEREIEEDIKQKRTVKSDNYNKRPACQYVNVWKEAAPTKPPVRSDECGKKLIK